MRVEFDTTEYRSAHAKEPRGYGSWAFEFPGNPEPWFAPTGTYAEAKKAAKVEAQRRTSAGWIVVKVLS